MEKVSGRKLVAIIGGYRETNENRKAWLVRVARAAGISTRRAYAAFYEEYLSERTRAKLQEAAAKRANEDDSELILRIHGYIRYLQATDPEMYRQDIDVAKRFLAQYEDHSSKGLSANVRGWPLYDC